MYTFAYHLTIKKKNIKRFAHNESVRDLLISRNYPVLSNAKSMQ